MTTSRRTRRATPTGTSQALSRGSHRSPRAGMCLMEYTSLLAGRPFGDDPDCTHPVLGVLARAVNDATSAAARVHLLRFAPALAQTRSTDPGDALRAADRCLALAGTVAPGWRRPRLRRMTHDIRRRANRLSGGAPASPADNLTAAEAMLEAVTVLRRLAANRRDTALAELLAHALAEAPTSTAPLTASFRTRGEGPGGHAVGAEAGTAATAARAGLR